MGWRYINNQNNLGHLKDSLAQKGIFSSIQSVIRVVYKNYIQRYLVYFYYKYLRSNKYFIFRGQAYRYFYHHYNFTNLNERCVEIAIIREIMEKYKGKRILEVGNVLAHYLKFAGDILDKYEKSPRVINQDAADFQTAHKYDLIVSVSTLEHIGRDDGSNDPDKIFSVLNNLRNCLSAEGLLIFTIPIGYNKSLDDNIRQGKININEQYYLQRKSKNNQWAEIRAEEAWLCQYDFPYRAGNAILIAYIKNDS